MRAFAVFVLLVTLAACGPEPALAQPNWSVAELDDLEVLAASATAEGLPAEDAALAEMELFRHLSDTDPAADDQIDVAADALFASLARSFAQGAADPLVADPDWAIPLAPAPDLAALQTAREAGAMPSALLRPLLPQAAEYAELRDELARLRAESGDDSARAQRINQVRASLERWRWLPREMPANRIEVRIPQYELRLIAPNAAADVRKIIVGARTTQTPSFLAAIQSVTLNPSWEPPASIAAELLRRFRRDPAAPAREGFEALRADGSVVPAGDVNWSARPFPYRLRQRPGPANALGRVRFDMPNDYAIRLHDTPSRSLFGRDMLALSHGCIRVEHPEELAAQLLAPEAWTAESLAAAIDMGEQQLVALNEPMPVYLIYITVTTSEAGEIAYADDIYRRDARVITALDAPDAALARRPAAPPPPCATE